MNKNITWKELKALDDIYHLNQTKALIQNHPYIDYLINDLYVLDFKPDNINIIVTTEQFGPFYEKEFKLAFEGAKKFLLANGIEATARKTFTLEDVNVLMLIAENKTELVSNLTTIEDFSNEFFDTSKYLKKKASVRNAVLRILGIEEFALGKKENNWRLVVDHQNPRAVVICENKSFMKQPWIAELAAVKLWYFGGNNIKIADNIDENEFKKPLYYCCDWDFDGIKIYLRLKAKLMERNAELKLLYPNLPHKKISTYIAYHNSHWDQSRQLSGLPMDAFNKKELQLLLELIDKECWIEEESFNLVEMLLELI